MVTDGRISELGTRPDLLATGRGCTVFWRRQQTHRGPPTRAEPPHRVLTFDPDEVAALADGVTGHRVRAI